MTYIPYSPQTGAKYTLTGPDGTIAVFNDPTDPNYVGMLTDVTGLDSADVREAGDVLSQTDGGWHGNFYYGRRPITLSGQVFGYSGPDARTARLDRLRRASNAMRADATLSWLNTDLSAVPMQTLVRRQQPLRISGPWIKNFQLLLVSKDAPLYSVAQHTAANTNFYPNGSFELITPPWFPTDYTIDNATGARVTSPTYPVHGTGYSGQLTANGSGPITVRGNGVALPWMTPSNGDALVAPNTSYNLSAWTYGGTTGRQWRVIAYWYDATNTFISSSTGADGPLNTGGWYQSTLTATSPPSAAAVKLYLQSTTTPANGELHYIADLAITYGTSPVGPLTVENQGDAITWPLITLTGPVNLPLTVTNNTTGSSIAFLPAFSLSGGYSVQIDTRNHTMSRYYNGQFESDQTGLLDFVNTTWPGMITGLNVYEPVVHPGSKPNYDFGMRLDWRDAWT